MKLRMPIALLAAQDFKTNTGHGKLLLDNSLYPEAYASNVNEQVCHHSGYVGHSLPTLAQLSWLGRLTCQAA
jgi:hypothetical protein